jgi:hypothetical protein
VQSTVLGLRSIGPEIPDVIGNLAKKYIALSLFVSLERLLYLEPKRKRGIVILHTPSIRPPYFPQPEKPRSIGT